MKSTLTKAALTLLFTVFSTVAAWAQSKDPIVTGYHTTSTTYVVYYHPNEDHNKLFDNELRTKWCITDFEGCYVEFYSNDVFVPTGYIMTTCSDNAQQKKRNPKSWVIKAKLNGDDEWTTIATVKDDKVMQDKNNTDFEFEINNTKPYKYFRFEVSDTQMGTGAHKIFQLAELRFRGHGAKPENYRYIKDLKLIGHTDPNQINTLAQSYKAQGWEVIGYNLNKYAYATNGKGYIFLLCKYENSNTANFGYITNLYIREGSNPPDNLDFNQCRYSLISCDGSSDFKNSKGNLNWTCTNSGVKNIYLYYTRDISNANYCLTGLSFDENKEGALGKDGYWVEGYNMKTGAGGLNLYLHTSAATANTYKVHFYSGIGVGEPPSTRCSYYPEHIAASKSTAKNKEFYNDNGDIGVKLESTYQDYLTPRNDSYVFLGWNLGNEVYHPLTSLDTDFTARWVHWLNNGGTITGMECTADLSTTMLTIPKTIGGTAITALSTGAFKQTAIRTINLNKIKSIGQEAFYGCSSLKNLYYEGTKAEWDAVTKGKNWKSGVASDFKEHWRSTVTFNANGHGTAPKAQTNLWSNEAKATEPAAPTAQTLVFTGWYTDAACTKRWNFSTQIPGDMTLYAGWEAQIKLSDNSSNNLSTIGVGSKSVSLEGRKIYCEGDWNTLCLPFSLSSLTGTPLEGFTVMELDAEAGSYEHVTGFDDGTLYLNFKPATSIEAGRPYIVKNTISYTATSGTTGYNNENYTQLVDGKTDKKWCSSIGHAGYDGGWVCEFKASSPINVTGYTLTTAGDTYPNHASRNPRIWMLQGKLNENDAWTDLDNRNVITTPADDLPTTNITPKSYAIAAGKQGTYKFFRFKVSQTGTDKMQLAELTLHTDITNPLFINVPFNAANPTAVTSSDSEVSFVGSYSPVTLAEGDKSKLFFGSSNTLCNPSTSMTIGSCRAYLTIAPKLPGDVNRNNEIDSADLTALTDYLLDKSATAVAPDVNGDTTVDIADVTALVGILLNGPKAPTVTRIVSNVEGLSFGIGDSAR